MSDTLLNDKKYIAHTYSRFPIEIVSGKGCTAIGADGKEYIDLGSGIGVNIFGYCDEEWVKAVSEQLVKLQHTSNLYYTEPCAELAKTMCEKTGMAKVFFANSGAEANECAIKAARKYAAEKKGGECKNILTLVNSFHGRTITTLAATGQESFHKDFLPLTDGFIYAPANDAEQVIEKIKEKSTAAVMFEVIQGEGGVIELDKNFLKETVKAARENDVLLIADEVQTGNGRTGQLYGYMNYSFTPDIVSTAKGLGGGLPIGAVMLSAKLADVFTPGTHGSTFGGNPVCCAGALNVMKRLDDDFLQSVRDKSDYVFSYLQNSPGIKSISGAGLMIGIETEKEASLIAKKCMENGVLVLTAKNKLRLLPPLNIPYDKLKEALDIIKKVCAEV